MMKEVIRALETGALPEVGLIAFLVAFVCIVLYAFTLSKNDRAHAKNLPLEDDAPLTSPHP
ncbi:MAG: cbb3-type cytochrome c oxidase subunit 3 [Bacteroidota bacterium]